MARADSFPRLSLTGLFANVSPELGNLFSQGKTWSIGAGLLGPIFRGGRIKRGYEAAQARWRQSQIEYEATAANAFGEVSRALADRAKLVETVVVHRDFVALFGGIPNREGILVAAATAALEHGRNGVSTALQLLTRRSLSSNVSITWGARTHRTRAVRVAALRQGVSTGPTLKPGKERADGIFRRGRLVS